MAKITNKVGDKTALGVIIFIVLLIDGHVSQVSAEPDSSSKSVAVIEKFEINPPFAITGQTCTLQWRTRNAVSARLSGIGAVPVNGKKKLTVGNRTTYVLTVKDSKGRSISETRKIIQKSLAPPPDIRNSKGKDLR